MTPNVFLSTTGNGLARAHRSDGDNWRVDNKLEGMQVNCLTTSPHDPNMAYAGTPQGILQSTDAGDSWTALGLKDQPVKSLAVSPHDPNVIYAGGRPANLYLSNDAGLTWSELIGFRKIRNRWWWFSPADPTFKAYVQSISISPEDPEVILAGIEFGAVVRSHDAGQTWSAHRKGALRDCHSLTFHHSNPTWAYEGGGSGGGAAFSQDGGCTWTQPRTGLDRSYGWAVAADPQRPEVWYLSASPQPSITGPWQPPAHIDGQANAFIFRSVGGAAWKKLNGGLPQPLDFMPYALLTDPEAPGHLYAGLSNGDIWHTSDHGDKWEQLPLNLGAVNRDMVMLAVE